MLATVVRETVAAVSEVRKIGWNVDMLVTASGYSAQTHDLGGKAVEGLYGVSVLPPAISFGGPCLATSCTSDPRSPAPCRKSNNGQRRSPAAS